jgi:hypothetical protein
VGATRSPYVSHLPGKELHAALRYVQFPEEESDPVLQMLRNAPIDDEEETEEERRLSEEARVEMRAGKGRPWSEVRAEPCPAPGETYGDWTR